MSKFIIMIERPHLELLSTRLSLPRKFIQVIFGPRQVGKTTTIRQILAQWEGPTHFAAADGEAASDANWLKSQWEVIRAHNTALHSALFGGYFRDTRKQPALWGRWVESAVGAYLLNQSFLHNYQVYYWRDGQAEVDFVIEKGQKLVSIEVKSTADRNQKGMELFAKQFKPHRQLLVGDGGLRWQDFLKMNVSKLFE